MSIPVTLYLDRTRVCDLELGKSDTLGDTVAVILNLVSDRLKLNSSVEEIVQNPPSHSDISFMLLGSKYRYIRGFNLAHLAQYREISLDQAVRRVETIDSVTTIIQDIAYSNTAEIYVFTKLIYWARDIYGFEERQRLALISHHKYLATEDATKQVEYRIQNQHLRRSLLDDVTNLIRSCEPKEQIHIPVSNSFIIGPSAIVSGKSVHITIEIVAAVNRKEDAQQVDESMIIRTLMDPINAIAASSGDSADNETRVSSIRYEEYQVGTTVDDDYKVALELHMSLNK